MVKEGFCISKSGEVEFCIELYHEVCRLEHKPFPSLYAIEDGHKPVKEGFFFFLSFLIKWDPLEVHISKKYKKNNKNTSHVNIS